MWMTISGSDTQIPKTDSIWKKEETNTLENSEICRKLEIIDLRRLDFMGLAYLIIYDGNRFKRNRFPFGLPNDIIKICRKK